MKLVLLSFLMAELCITSIVVQFSCGDSINVRYLFEWGSVGAGDGYFSTPSGIEINSTGYVYVVDTNQNRIQVFTESGKYISRWGSYGTADGQFNFPWSSEIGIAINGSGCVYVADTDNDRVQLFDSTGTFLNKWGSTGAGDGQFNYSKWIALNVSGNVYVTDFSNNRVQVFAANGTFLFKWGAYGTGDGQFKGANGIAINETGYVYVVDYYNARVQVFAADGTFLFKWGGQGTGDGEFIWPNDIKIDNLGRIYVADQGNYRIQVFSPNGNFLYKWGKSGSKASEFYSVGGIAVNNSGAIYATDRNNNRVQVFGLNGGGESPFEMGWVYLVICAFAFGTIFYVKRNSVKIYLSKLKYRLNSAPKTPKSVKLKEIYPPSVQIDQDMNIHPRIIEEPMQPNEVVQTIQENHKKTFVQIKRQYEYIGGKVRVKVLVKNLFLKGLFRLSLMLDIPPSLKLLRTEPPDYPREGTTVKIGELLTTDEKSVAWVLEPLICGKENVGGTASGLDNNEKPFAVSMEPLIIEVRCPLFVQPGEANLPILKQMWKDLPVHSERYYIMPETFSFDHAYEVAASAISERDVRLVGVVDDVAGLEKTAWFYGTTKVGQRRYIMTASVHKNEHLIQFSTACDDEEGCTGFLAEVGRSVRQELVIRGAVDNEECVKELYCTKCGEPLTVRSITRGNVTCPKCGWACLLKDFPI